MSILAPELSRSAAQAWRRYVCKFLESLRWSKLILSTGNMGAEVGATTSLFPFSPAHIPYLEATHRGPIAQEASKIANSPMQRNLLRADSEAEYDKVITINLSTLEPHINGPFTPDLSTPLSKFKSVVEEKDWPRTFGAGLIGSCTNSSYQDMTRSEEIVKQAEAAGLKPKADFFITPGSEQIRATLDRDNTLSTFTSAGGTVLANACGKLHVLFYCRVLEYQSPSCGCLLFGMVGC